MCLVNDCAHRHTCVAPTQTSRTLPAARGLPRAPVWPALFSRPASQSVFAPRTNGGPDFSAQWQPEDIGRRWGWRGHAQQPRDVVSFGQVSGLRELAGGAVWGRPVLSRSGEACVGASGKRTAVPAA